MGLSIPNSTQKLCIAISMQVNPTSCCQYGAVIISRVKGEEEKGIKVKKNTYLSTFYNYHFCFT